MKWLELSWKNIIIMIVAWIIAVLLHNAIGALFNFEEAFFFIVAIFVIPIYFIVSLVYTVIIKLRGKK